MKEIKIRILHTGSVCVAPALPFGGENHNPLKMSPIMVRNKDRLWLPVSSYFIEHPKGKILVDCGWHRDMSPNGEFDKIAQIRSLGSRALYLVNQGKLEKGKAVDEQLMKIGIKPSDLDYVLLSHLDCDHVNGLGLVKGAKHILVSQDELEGSRKKDRKSQIRYQSKWWEGCNLQAFDWNDNEGPFEKSFDLFGDGSVKMIAIPGHSDGLCAVKIKNDDGKYVLLFSDGGYATKSWKEMILPGVSTDKAAQRKSLAWIREESMSENYIASLANHDAEVTPHEICL